MRFHIEMEADRPVREQGLDPLEARRQAQVRFGGVEKSKDEGRDARGRERLATFYEVITGVIDPALPLEHGDRIVALQYSSVDGGDSERRVLHDFAAWREELVSVEQLGAFRTAQHNLVTASATPRSFVAE